MIVICDPRIPESLQNCCDNGASYGRGCDTHRHHDDDEWDSSILQPHVNHFTTLATLISQIDGGLKLKASVAIGTFGTHITLW